MSGITLHSLLIFRSKNNSSEYCFVPRTLTGEEIFERHKAGKEAYIRSWAKNWEFVGAKEKIVYEKDWSINLNWQDFTLEIEDESIFNDQVEFKALAALHPILQFFFYFQG